MDTKIKNANIRSGMPMMADREIQIIDELIEKHQVKRVLEWGSGNSTTYFSSKHECIEEWIAIEHASDYFEITRDKIKDTQNTKAKVEHITNREGYINDPLKWGEFDLILVDGLYRDECMVNALKIAHGGTIVLLHDSARKESARMMEKYKDRIRILCDGELPQPTGFMAHRGIARLN